MAVGEHNLVDEPLRAKGARIGAPQARDWMLAIGPGLALGSLVAWLCWWTTRSRGMALAGMAGEMTPTLGTFFGGLAAVTTLVPGLTLAQAGRWKRVFPAVGVVMGVAVVWLVGIDRSLFEYATWAKSAAVLLAYGLALGGVASLLARARIGTTWAGALTMLAGVAWLSWPVWLAPWIGRLGGEELVGGLVTWHPLFAMDGLLAGVFPSAWSQQHIAYVLTNIGDDYSYSLPGVGGCVAFHALLGMAGHLAACLNRSRPIV